jgi:hypothetical protein
MKNFILTVINIIQATANFIQTVIFIALVKDYMERKYNSNFTNLFVTISYNIIYVYSKGQILLIKLNKNIVLFIESNPTLLKISNDIKSLSSSKNEEINKNTIEFVKNGEVIKNIRCNNFKCNNIKSNDSNCEELINAYENEYDFLIYSHLNENNCFNKKILQKGEEITSPIYELSNISFMLVELHIDNNIFKINLKNEKHNFYVQGNRLSFDFFMYYLKNIELNTTFELSSSNSISVHIIDQNVDKCVLDFIDDNSITNDNSITDDNSRYILIEKDTYKLNISLNGPEQK